MTKYLLLFVALTIATKVSAQKIDKFCRITMYNPASLHFKYEPKIALGENQSLFNLKDTTELHELKKVNTLTTDVDVLNFMSNAGWELVYTKFGNTHPYSYYFKKTYDKSELN